MSFKPMHTLDARVFDCQIHGRVDEHLVRQFGGAAQWRGCANCLFEARNSADPAVYQPARRVYAEQRLNEQLLAAGIPLRFESATLANYEITAPQGLQDIALKACQDYAADFVTNWQAGRCLLLLGTVGTGKTHLASGIIQAVITTLQASARYTSALAIIRDVKATFSQGSTKTEAQVYADLAAVELLVVDEIGVQNGTDFERQVMFEVINARYERKLPTVIISNLGLKELRKCLGDRAVDRLTDAQGIVAMFNWTSQRGAV